MDIEIPNPALPVTAKYSCYTCEAEILIRCKVEFWGKAASDTCPVCGGVVNKPTETPANPRPAA